MSIIRVATVNNTKSIFPKILVAFTTIVMLFPLGILTPIKAQTINGNSSNTIFYGNNTSPTKMGGEYIVFQLTNNLAVGLVYVQNYEDFSCFKGSYNRRNRSLIELTFAYPDMGTGRWIKTKSNETLSLTDFPHQLNYGQISEGANNLFKECLNIFSGFTHQTREKPLPKS